MPADRRCDQSGQNPQLSRRSFFRSGFSTYNEAKAKSFAQLDHLILVCGHYEGVDERVNAYCDELLSIGDYILTGGEVPAMAVTDSVTRLLDGAIAAESLVDESFNQPLLEYPQYTEPYDYDGAKVPDILYSGNHEAIAKWRRKQSLALTKRYRPDLFKKLTLDKKDLKLLKELESDDTPDWEEKALQKGHKFIKKD
jgi:tRNA (guanine37-N1)-methyltransferase